MVKRNGGARYVKALTIRCAQGGRDWWCKAEATHRCECGFYFCADHSSEHGRENVHNATPLAVEIVESLPDLGVIASNDAGGCR